MMALWPLSMEVILENEESTLVKSWATKEIPEKANEVQVAVTSPKPGYE